MGPLTICKDNPRYFADHTGRPVLMTGFHTWNNLVDMGRSDPPPPFEYERYLRTLSGLGHNFIRLWAWDMVTTWDRRDTVGQFPWKRTGPGNAVDGKPKFDLTVIDECYLQRLAERVRMARAQGIYVSVMLLEGWCSVLASGAPVENHCFAGANNVNGIDILASSDGEYLRAWTTLEYPDVLELQKRYIARVVEALGDFDNVLYEIANECGEVSHDWQDHLVGYIKELESHTRCRHPVGQTGGMGTLNRRLFEGPADWVSPEAFAADGLGHAYRTGGYTWGEAPFDRGDRPVFLDTDHLWGIGGDVAWVWKSLCRGYNMLYMDRVDDFPSSFYEHPHWNDVRTNLDVRSALGAVRTAAARLDLARARPCSHAASTCYCLAEPGSAYLVYQPGAGPFQVMAAPGQYLVEWLDPVRGDVRYCEVRDLKGRFQTFVPPVDGNAVLVLKRQR